MSSNIDQVIEEIEDYIENCKFKLMSSTDIIVNKDEILELIADLRRKTPEEVKRYQKIISNKEAILADAQQKADAIISQAQIQKNELVREHQIMQQAYAQANEVVAAAQKKAQEILDSATQNANEIQMGAIEYTDSMLKSVEEMISHSHSIFKTNFSQLTASMQKTLEVVAANRAELAPASAQQTNTNSKQRPKETPEKQQPAAPEKQPEPEAKES